MEAKDFFGKIFSKFLLGNLLAMFLVVIALMVGVKYGLDWYTHHGEGIKVPKVEGMLFSVIQAITNNCRQTVFLPRIQERVQWLSRGIPYI